MIISNNDSNKNVWIILLHSIVCKRTNTVPVWLVNLYYIRLYTGNEPVQNPCRRRNFQPFFYSGIPCWHCYRFRRQKQKRARLQLHCDDCKSLASNIDKSCGYMPVGAPYKSLPILTCIQASSSSPKYSSVRSNTCLWYSVIQYNHSGALRCNTQVQRSMGQLGGRRALLQVAS